MIVEDNRICLSQAVTFLKTVKQARYRQPVDECFGSSIGGHMRHILDHYQCLLGGIDLRKIDYDGRQRDPRLEQNIDMAVSALHTVSDQLDSLEVNLAAAVQVKMDTGSYDPLPWVDSTVARELQFLLSHTVHHYALIATMCGIMGQPVPVYFGIAPSTLKYRAEIGD